MITTCPNCGKRLTVSETDVGKHARCPSCQSTFTVAAAPPEPPPPPPPGSQFVAPPTAAKSSLGASGVFNIIGLVGAVLALVSVFLPWWSFTLKLKNLDDFGRTMDRPERNKAVFVRIAKIYVNNAGWYVNHSYVVDVDKIVELIDSGPKSKDEITFRAWGWQGASGIATIVLSVAAIGLLIAMLASGTLRRWGWIGSFLMAGIGVPIVVFSLAWVIGSPGQDVEPYFTQGIHVGPLILLPGSLILLLGGVIGGVLGLREFLQRLKARGA
jgi:predicted Zn finger-like uncharacterized protein